MFSVEASDGQHLYVNHKEDARIQSRICCRENRFLMQEREIMGQQLQSECSLVLTDTSDTRHIAVVASIWGLLSRGHPVFLLSWPSALSRTLQTGNTCSGPFFCESCV